jgi:diaminohydroxyphosphoribosylaminopyrimidine deaminase/5-amino-6-(5-phosphoribosylamino)uracil reductase
VTRAAILDEAYMRLAIAEAEAGHGLTAPNPSVGCVLVKGAAILASAATAPGGRPHAEEQALAAAGPEARGCTAYVTLEPCGARSSPTASCSQRLADAGVVRLVYACEDPSPLASGRGGERLRAAGVTVEAGLLAHEAAPLYADWIAALRNP